MTSFVSSATRASLTTGPSSVSQWARAARGTRVRRRAPARARAGACLMALAPLSEGSRARAPRDRPPSKGGREGAPRSLIMQFQLDSRRCGRSSAPSKAANSERAKTVPITASASSSAGMSRRTSPRAEASRSAATTKSRVRNTASLTARAPFAGRAFPNCSERTSWGMPACSAASLERAATNCLSLSRGGRAAGGNVASRRVTARLAASFSMDVREGKCRNRAPEVRPSSRARRSMVRAAMPSRPAILRIASAISDLRPESGLRGIPALCK